jgi:hypothetical protein
MGIRAMNKGSGIRCATKAAADVDEADAMFVVGACSAFLSYLVNKSRSAGLLDVSR